MKLYGDMFAGSALAEALDAVLAGAGLVLANRPWRLVGVAMMSVFQLIGCPEAGRRRWVGERTNGIQGCGKSE